MRRRVDNLCADVVVGAWQRLLQLRTRDDEIEQLVGEHTVAVEQVLNAHLVHPEGAGDLRALVPRRLVTFRAEKGDVFCRRRGNLAVERRDCLVNGVLRHHAVGRPLAARDNHESWHAVRDDVLAAQLRSLVALAREQRAKARVDALNVIAGERHGQHFIDVLEDVVDVSRGRRRVRFVEVPIGVGGADQPMTTPRNDE